MHFFDEPELPRPDGLADGASVSREPVDGDRLGDPRGNHGPAEGVAVMQTRFEGRVWTFGDDISTDHIIAGKYLGTTDPKVFAEHAFESVDPTWAKKVQRGDMIVAGANFGCGSSREQAPVALKTLEISAILANSFARIFFRNAINLGFPVLECPGLKAKVKAGEVVDLDMARGEVHLPDGSTMRFRALPPNVLEILEAGGLVPKLRKELAAKSKTQVVQGPH